MVHVSFPLLPTPYHLPPTTYRALLLALRFFGSVLIASLIAWLSLFVTAFFSLSPAYLDVRFLALVIILSFFSLPRSTLLFATIFFILSYLADPSIILAILLYTIIGGTLFLLSRRLFVERTVWSFLFLVVTGSLMLSTGYALLSVTPSFAHFARDAGVSIIVHSILALALYALLMSLSTSWNRTFIQR